MRQITIVDNTTSESINSACRFPSIPPSARNVLAALAACAGCLAGSPWSNNVVLARPTSTTTISPVTRPSDNTSTCPLRLASDTT